MHVNCDDCANFVSASYYGTFDPIKYEDHILCHINEKTFSQRATSEHLAAYHRYIAFIKDNAQALDDIISSAPRRAWSYISMNALLRTYLLRSCVNNQVYERPEDMFMRAAIQLGGTDINSISEIFNDMYVKGIYFHATPTMVNAACHNNTLSSCYMLEAEDSIDSIYETNTELAKISKSMGGTAVYVSNIRPKNAIIGTTRQKTDGPLPFIQMYNHTIRTVNQGGKRNGSCAAFMEMHNPHILEHINSRNPTTSHENGYHSLFNAVSISDEFMRRAKYVVPEYLAERDNLSDEERATFDASMKPEILERDLLYREIGNRWPVVRDHHVNKELNELYGEKYATRLYRYEKEQSPHFVSATGLLEAIAKNSIESGTPYVFFKDAANATSTHTAALKKTVKMSNLCMEIVQHTDDSTNAICNLGQVVLPKAYGKGFDGVPFDHIEAATRALVRNINRVIDTSKHVTDRSTKGMKEYRAIAIGVSGAMDMLANMGITDICSPEACDIMRYVAESIYYYAFDESVEMVRRGDQPALEPFVSEFRRDPRFHHEKWDNRNKSGAKVTLSTKTTHDWEALRNKAREYGFCNSLFTGYMPTATTAQVLDVSDCFEPYFGKEIKKRVLSGDFIQVNKHAVEGNTCWTIKMKDYMNTYISSMVPFIDQSMSMNLFMAKPTIGKVFSMLVHSHSLGFKTGVYYLRVPPKGSTEVSEGCKMCQ